MSIFVDTGGWYASVVPADPNHGAVVSLLMSTHPTLVTTDYVVDETLTLLRARGDGDKAIVLGRQFFDLSTANVHRLTPDELRAAWELFRDRPDRDWSFTDCTRMRPPTHLTC